MKRFVWIVIITCALALQSASGQSKVPSTETKQLAPDDSRKEHILPYIVAQDYGAIYFETAINFMFDLSGESASCIMVLPNGARQPVQVNEHIATVIRLDKSRMLYGQVSITCPSWVFVDATISQFDRYGRKTGETNIFAVRSGSYSASMVVDTTGGERAAIALSNTTELTRYYQLALYRESEPHVTGVVVYRIPGKSTVAFFLDEYDALKTDAGINTLHVWGAKKSVYDDTVAWDVDADFAMVGFRYTHGEFYSAVPSRDSDFLPLHWGDWSWPDNLN